MGSRYITHVESKGLEEVLHEEAALESVPAQSEPLFAAFPPARAQQVMDLLLKSTQSEVQGAPAPGRSAGKRCALHSRSPSAPRVRPKNRPLGALGIRCLGGETVQKHLNILKYT